MSAPGATRTRKPGVGQRCAWRRWRARARRPRPRSRTTSRPSRGCRPPSRCRGRSLSCEPSDAPCVALGDAAPDHRLAARRVEHAALGDRRPRRGRAAPSARRRAPARSRARRPGVRRTAAPRARARSAGCPRRRARCPRRSGSPGSDSSESWLEPSLVAPLRITTRFSGEPDETSVRFRLAIRLQNSVVAITTSAITATREGGARAARDQAAPAVRERQRHAARRPRAASARRCASTRRARAASRTGSR